MILDKFKTYDQFGKSTLEEVYGDMLKKALNYRARTFESVALIRNGDKFEIRSLPHRAQIAPVNGIVMEDFDGDQKKDLVIGGNLFVSEVETGRADAGTGLFLKGNATGWFDEVNPGKSGLAISGDVKNILLIKKSYSGEPYLLIANNNGPIQLISVKKGE